MDDLSFLQNLDSEAVEELYQKYREDPGSIDPSWHHFFQGFDLARKDYSHPESESLTFDEEFRVINLINGYRKRGHLFTETNPVRSRRKYFPTLDLENYGLAEKNLETYYHAGREIGCGKATLRDIVDNLKKTYCGHIGSEYMFKRNPVQVKWLSDHIEKGQNRNIFTPEEKKRIFQHLVEAVGFEKFIHNKFVGQKRFSLEGAEILIPALNDLVEQGAALGAEEFNIGMAHRGRLNVLANVLMKPNEEIFNEFEGESYEQHISLGDVKYHLGYGNTVRTKAGKAEKEAFMEANKGKELISEDDLEIAKQCQIAIAEHPSASALFSKKGVAESSFFWDKDGLNLNTGTHTDQPFACAVFGDLFGHYFRARDGAVSAKRLAEIFRQSGHCREILCPALIEPIP